MIYSDNTLTTFSQKYAKDLILCCYGDDAINYAEEFEFTDYHIKKYQNNIIDNINYIENKNILDIGSNTGLWAVLMYLNGAKNVTCIEPRQQFSDGINKFAKLHNLPITSHNALHNHVYNLNKNFDTTVMMGIDDLIPDIITFLGKLQNISNYLLLKTRNTDSSVDKNSIKIITNQDNFGHRDGFHVNTDINNCTGYGYQSNFEKFLNNDISGKFIKSQYGKNFYESIFEYFGYEILDFQNKDTNDNIFFKHYSVKLK